MNNFKTSSAKNIQQSAQFQDCYLAERRGDLVIQLERVVQGRTRRGAGAGDTARRAGVGSCGRRGSSTGSLATSGRMRSKIRRRFENVARPLENHKICGDAELRGPENAEKINLIDLQNGR